MKLKFYINHKVGEISYEKQIEVLHITNVLIKNNVKFEFVDSEEKIVYLHDVKTKDKQFQEKYIQKLNYLESYDDRSKK